MSLMQNLGLEDQVLSIVDEFPDKSRFTYNVDDEQKRLETFRQNSKEYLINALKDE